jgi:hypothetical protein
MIVFFFFFGFRMERRRQPNNGQYHEMTGHGLHFETTVQMCRRMQSNCKRLPVVESKGGEFEEVGGVEMDGGGEFQMTVALSPSSLIDKILSYLDID